jgi:hypothetical protein
VLVVCVYLKVLIHRLITNIRFEAVNRAVSAPNNERKIKILFVIVGIVYGIGIFVLYPVVSILVI